MSVSIVISCWNGQKLLEKNLPRVIEASENSENKIKEILVVDDGSTDESVEYINKVKNQKSCLPKPGTGKQAKVKIRMIKHDKNYGYSKTCNTGVHEASGELVAILNLDVVPSKDFLVETLPHFEDKKVFSVSFNEGKFGPGRLEWKDGFLEIVPSEIIFGASLTDWPSGGSSIFRKSIWEELGGMDELFLPFYFEDIDLGLRARKKGYKCLWEPKAKVEHEHEGTINKDNFRGNFINSIKQRNHLLLAWKHLDSPKLFSKHLFNLAKQCIVHPGYLKIVALAVKRIVFSSTKENSSRGS